MRTRIIRLLALSTMLCGGTMLLAQPGPGDPRKTPGSAPTVGTPPSVGTKAKTTEPGSLEEMLDKALRNNPDVRAAEAKVREVEAELNRVRHQVIAKVVGLRNDIELSKKMLSYSERVTTRTLELMRKGAVQQQDLEIANSNLEKQRAEVAKLEADLKAVLGSYGFATVKGLTFGPDRGLDPLSGNRIWTIEEQERAIRTYFPVKNPNYLSGKLSVQTPMAERIKAALDKSVKLEDLKEPMPFTEVLDFFAKKANIDVPFRVLGKFDQEKVSLMKTELSVGAWLQALEDSVPNLRFVVRDYGILATTRERAPEGAISVQEFWKRVEEKPKQSTTPPPFSPKP